MLLLVFLCAYCRGLLPAVVTALEESRKVRRRTPVCPSITLRDARAACATVLHSEQSHCSLSAFSCGRQLMVELSYTAPLMKWFVNRKVVCCAQSFDDPITTIPSPTI